MARGEYHVVLFLNVFVDCCLLFLIYSDFSNSIIIFYFEYTCSTPKQRLSDDSGVEEAEGVEIEIAVEEGKAESCSDKRQQGVDEGRSGVKADSGCNNNRQQCVDERRSCVKADSASNNNIDVDEAKADREKAEGAVAK